MFAAMAVSAWATRAAARALTEPARCGRPARSAFVDNAMHMSKVFRTLGIVGTGAMGRGIAQIAAQAGSTVKLFDTQPAAIEAARKSVGEQWDKLQAPRASWMRPPRQATKSGWSRPARWPDLHDCDCVIEAVVERLDVKQKLFQELEGIVRAGRGCLATNTSSLSVTAIAAALEQPQRFAGYHFFNPVPLMKVVEVIAGLKTAAQVCTRLATYGREMGHTAVQAQDTPGFIVNHAGRGYGTEALRIVGEGVSDFATIDRILKDQVGFRLGPFELMDLTALDVSHPVMESVYRQYYDEPRFRPSVITAQRLAGRRGRPARSAKASIAMSTARRRLHRSHPFRAWPSCRRSGCRAVRRAAPSC